MALREGTNPDILIGKRAFTVQTYTEANSKAGAEHEGSIKYDAPANGVNNTFFVTGALPIVLQSRQISYTGTGITAEIFTGATYTAGTALTYYNASDINPIAGLVQIIEGATLDTTGTLIFAPKHLIGNSSNQGNGATNSIIGGVHVLKPNTVYLLRITSLDAAVQTVASHLSWYEGELDIPQ